MKARPELLAKAQQAGAVLTGKPDSTERITVMFSIEAWRAFDAALLAAEHVSELCLCEVGRLVLRVGWLYRFTECENCEACKKAGDAAREAYGEQEGGPRA